MGRPYTVIDTRAVSTAITVLQVTAPATMTLEIIRAWVTQSSSTTSAQSDVILVRKSATITGTSITPVKLEPGDPSPTFTALRTASAEGTDTDTVAGEGFNVLNGWLYVPVPEERIKVPPSGILGLKFPSAPPNVTYRYGITLREHG